MTMKHGHLSIILYCKRRPCFHPPLYQRSDLWSLCPFHEKLGGLPLWSSDVTCCDLKKEEKKKTLTCSVCVWDECWTVAVLTAANLLIYLADLLYMALEAL